MSSSTSGTSASTATQIAGYLNTAQTLSALTGTTPGSPTISGLVSGIDSQSIIDALMQQAEEPQTQLKSQLTTVQNTLTDWSSLNSDATQLQTAADVLTAPSDWQTFQAASTSQAVSATAGAGATAGSMTFTVDQLAAAASVVTNSAVTSPNSQVTTASTLLLAQGGGALGFGSFSGDLGVGAHTISVTTAATSASVTGSAAPAASTTITAGSNDTIDYSLDGTSGTLTLAPGANLTPAQLAAEINAASAASGAGLTASISPSGALSIASSAQGSSQVLNITGGTALSALNMSSGQSGTGTDGVVSVDGVDTTLTDVVTGSAVTLNTSGGTMQATISGPMAVGSINAQEVSTGTGSLNDVVQAVNAAGAGITASAVQVGSNAYRLELTSTTTGANSALDLDPNAFAAAGGTSVLTAGADAQLTVGTGPGAFVMSSSTNTVTGLMPGVSLQLNGTTGTTPVTVTLTPDSSAMASRVSTMVSAANALIADLETAMTLPATSSSSTSTSGSGTSSSSTTNSLEGLLLGDPTANDLMDSILGAVSGQAGAGGTGAAGLVGITMNTDGTLSFDQDAFESAYAANPTAVAATFTQGATSSSSQMSFYQATDSTSAGSYAVDVTQAATQASVTGAAVPGGALSGAETISLSGAGGAASYAAAAGESLADVAAGINSATAAAGVGVEATVTNGALTLTSTAFGADGDFTVSSTAAGPGSTGLVTTAGATTSASGQDVQGTIDGQAATGSGQLLLGALGTPAQGLMVQVTATPAQVAANGDLGTIDYTPGVAQALAAAAQAASDPIDGLITNAVNGLNTTATDLQTQITNWNPILSQKQQQLQQEYTAMETALASLDSTKSQLGQTFSSSSSGG